MVISRIGLSPWARKLIPLAFYVLLVVFLAFYLKSIDWAKLKDVDISWVYFAIASIFGLAFRYWATFIWFVLLKSLGASHFKRVARELIYVYAKSWLGRYIPGTAPWILGKIYFASQHGISKNKLAVSSILEGALQVVVLMGISFLMLVFDKRLDVVGINTKLIMLGVLLGCIVAMIPAIFNRVISIAYKLIRKKALDKEHLASGKTILKGASLYVVGAIISGLSLFFISKAVYPELSYGNILFVMGASNLAGAIGMLALFAPSGIGVREGVQLVLLSAIMPKEFALLVVVVSRLWSVVIDFAFFGISRLMIAGRSRA